MKSVINSAILHIWPSIAALTGLKTPDDEVGRSFAIANHSENFVVICTEEGSKIKINREAFAEALLYLIEYKHGSSNPCEIRSSQILDKAGPLCKATRTLNGGTRVISYIVPILVSVGFLGVSGVRPNAVWLV